MKAFTTEVVPYTLLQVGAWLMVAALTIVLLPLAIVQKARPASVA